MDDLPGPVPEGFQPGEGVFITNEGQFLVGNASVSYYRFATGEVEQELFQSHNGRPLGDVLQSLYLADSVIWLVVNNSERLEEVDAASWQSLGSITGLPTPRYFLPVRAGTAYVTELFADAVTIVDTETFIITGTIPLPGWTEELLIHQSLVWITNRRTDQLYVLDPISDTVIDSVAVGFNSNALQLDAEGMLWVLCSGNPDTDEPGGLYRVDPASRQVVRSLLFADNNMGQWPRLAMNAARDTLYYLKEDVFRLPVAAMSAPGTPFIPSGGRTLYALGIDPRNSEVYVGDALDFQQRGQVYIYRPDGQERVQFSAGVIPNGFWFY
jgi:DNA-binding beta-propeller fold protein YncE